MTPEELQTAAAASLTAAGFKPPRWFSAPRLDRTLRLHSEIVARVMAVDALYTWVAVPEAESHSGAIRQFVQRNQLTGVMTNAEAEVLSLRRDHAHAEFEQTATNLLEYLRTLAWVLGFDHRPDLAPSAADAVFDRALLADFLAPLEDSVRDGVAATCVREAEHVIALEYEYEYALNAIRSALEGHATVPAGLPLDELADRALARRHALVWCLSPGVDWDEIALST